MNRFKQSAPEVVVRYQDASGMLYRSDYHGALALHFGSGLAGRRQIEVASWRSQYKRYWHDSISQ